MLDQSWIETSGRQVLPMDTDSSEYDKRCAISTPRPPGCHRKNTVKELIMMRRVGSHSGQKRNCSQKKNILGHKFKSVKPDSFYQSIASECSLHLLSTPAPVNPSIPNQFLPGPENGHVTPQLVQHPAPITDGKMTFFHWQILQEANRMEGVHPEVLSLQDEDGDTCLHIAVAQGKRALAYVLAAKMAGIGSLDMKEHNGQTALQIAVATNQHLIVQDLLAHGAQVNSRDCWGRSPVHVCAKKGHFLSLQSIQMALTGNWQLIDIEMFNYDGLTPLHAAVLSHNAVVKELRSLESICSFMAAKLMQKRQMYRECIKTLLLMGACCGTKDLKSGRTSLHMASEEANVELFHLFLEQPSSLSIVNVKTFNGNTALHIVSSLQNHKAQVDAVRLLMRRGADPGARNIENELPAQLVPVGPIGEKVRQILKGKDVHT
ncbi:NF-kappa-B inhibitor zeta [Centroberyx gerrardi]